MSNDFLQFFKIFFVFLIFIPISVHFYPEKARNRRNYLNISIALDHRARFVVSYFTTAIRDI